MSTSVFEIPIEGQNADQVIEAVAKSEKPVWIVTVNPEILLEVRKNKDYKEAIVKAQERVVDGFGLFAMLRVFGDRVSRVTGVELAERLIQEVHQRKWRVGLLGGMPEAAQKSAESLQVAYPGLEILAEEGGRISKEGDEDKHGEEARFRMTQFAPHVLLVAFGHPKQERWIEKHIGDFPTAKALMGVGGTFEFWSGQIKRAPKWMRSIGMEWLWRLIQQPSRLGRMFRAVVMFPFLYIVSLFRFPK
ncbi:MAG: WecB/TagA/CpsF family glycosyltransferase [bacterium]|nr:WecB/TagA/CpsF family glycosyltransferase [bacterium]